MQAQLPKIGDPHPLGPGVPLDMQVTVTGPVEPTGEVVSISVPLFHWTAGNAHRKVTALRLTRQQAATLKSLTMGLENQEAQLKDGRFVSRPVDAIRWMLEQLQQS